MNAQEGDQPSPMSAEQRDRRRRRYLVLGIGELVAATVFVGVAVLAVRPRLSDPDWLTLWCGLGPLVLILLQAGIYWLLARVRVGGRPMSTATAAAYRICRVANPLLLAGGAVAILVRGADGAGSLILFLAVWVFAVLEHVNYFVVRLAYPAHRWATEVTRWRTPQLVRDLRKS